MSVVVGYKKTVAPNDVRSYPVDERYLVPLEVTTISRLAVIAGDHSILVTQLTRGKRAGRYALAYNFFARWRFVTDVDSDELLTWKTQEEALIIGEAWRHAWERTHAEIEAKRATSHARSILG